MKERLLHVIDSRLRTGRRTLTAAMRQKRTFATESGYHPLLTHFGL